MSHEQQVVNKRDFNKMKNYSLCIVIAILAPLSFSFAWALDIYIPVSSKLISILHTNQSMIQMTLSLFLAFVGIGQLLFGPISDQIGRRAMAIISTLVFILGSLLCALSHDIYLLIFSRVIQALGGCGMLNASMAIIRDLFDEIKSARAYSFLNGSIAFSPLLAPFVGSYLDIWFGWRSIFVFLIGLGLICSAVTVCFIQETLPPQNRVKFNVSIFNRYFTVLKSKEFIFFGTCSVVGIGCLFSFFSISSKAP